MNAYKLGPIFGGKTVYTGGPEGQKQNVLGKRGRILNIIGAFAADGVKCSWEQAAQTYGESKARAKGKLRLS